MSKKLRNKLNRDRITEILSKHIPKRQIRIWCMAAVLVLSSVAAPWCRLTTNAESCPDVRVVFARGSGGERWNTDDYLSFKQTIEEKLVTTSLSYEFIDLDYPAIGVNNLKVLAGAFFGSGDAYEFGASVNQGVQNLTTLVNDSKCVNTKYVLGGYSQGAMVVSKGLGSLNADRLIYAATFGDPKIYLPEGKGLIPAACRGENLSDYRMYVPDCQAYKGLLGSYIPYEPEAFVGKVGTWCNKRDIFCSSRLNMSDHLSYVSENLYEDASRVIIDKICKTFGVSNSISSPHDTAILIDSTGSMSSMIEKYKSEALRLATETLENGGRVALYDYRDLGDPYEPVQHCNFDTCTLETFGVELGKIKAGGGGDRAESLLSASYHTMSELEWQKGSTKSLVILTDADFLSPDRDGMTFDEVVALSKRIDPVNFYIITSASYGDYYEALATATDGKVVTNFDELSLLTDYIMERYDSLPRVEEGAAITELPKLSVVGIRQTTESEMTVEYTTSSEVVSVIVALNDAILGMTEGEIDMETGNRTITIGGLDNSIDNVLTLVPLSSEIRGESENARLVLDAGWKNNRGNGLDDAQAHAEAEDEISGRGGVVAKIENDGVDNKISMATVVLPKAPNTGKR